MNYGFRFLSSSAILLLSAAMLPGCPDRTPPGDVSAFTATFGNSQVSLSWHNPPDKDFAGVKVIRGSDGFPSAPKANMVVYDGTDESAVDSNVVNGTTYYYTAFAYDAKSNLSGGATASTTPMGGEGEGEREGEGEEEGEGEAGPGICIVIDPAVQDTRSISSSPFVVHGIVRLFNGAPMPAELYWSLVSGNDNPSGTAAVDAGGIWSFPVSLAAGDNLIRVSAPDWPETESVTVTYTPGYAFGGPLSITPDVVYAGATQSLLAMVDLTDSSTDPGAVRLVRVNGGTETEVGAFADDGNEEQGDEVAGDGIYTCVFILEEDAPGTALFRVSAGRKGGAEPVLSESVDVMVAEANTKEEFDTALDLVKDYTSELGAADDEHAPQVAASILNALRERSDFVEGGLTPDGYGVWGRLTSNIPFVIYTREDTLLASPSGKRSGSMAKETGAPEPAQSPYQDYRIYGSISTSPEKSGGACFPLVGNRVFSLCSIYDNTGHPDDPDDEAAVICTPLLNRLDTTDMPVKHRSGFGPTGKVEEFKRLGQYSVILIETHGNVYGPASQEQVIISTMDNVVESNYTQYLRLQKSGKSSGKAGGDVISWKLKQYQDDIKRGRMVIQGQTRSGYESNATYCILPSFIRKYSGRFPYSVVLMLACYSAHNQTMATAFFQQGAGSYFGFSEPTCYQFTRRVAPDLVGPWGQGNVALSEVFVPGQLDDTVLAPSLGVKKPDPPAEFRLLGDETTCIGDGLKDGGFESDPISQVWTLTGTARGAHVVGPLLPSKGDGMAVLSLPAATLSQVFRVPTRESTIFFSMRRYMRAHGRGYQPWFTLNARIEEVGNPGNFHDEGNRLLWMQYGEDYDTSASIGYCSCCPPAGDDDLMDNKMTDWGRDDVYIPASMRGKLARLTFTVATTGAIPCTGFVLLDDIEVRIW